MSRLAIYRVIQFGFYVLGNWSGKKIVLYCRFYIAHRILFVSKKGFVFFFYKIFCIRKEFQVHKKNIGTTCG